jgi:hypothetical protein
MGDIIHKQRSGKQTLVRKKNIMKKRSMKKDPHSFFGELCDDGQILPRDESVEGRVVHERRRVVILVLYAQADCSAPPFSVHKCRQRVDAQLLGEIRRLL